MQKRTADDRTRIRHPALNGKEPTSDLLGRVQAGDGDAVAVLYERYGLMVYRTAYSLMRNTADAEDVFHDVFLGLRTAVGKYSGHGSFEGWLGRVTMRTALMALRRRRSRAEVSIESAPPLAARGETMTTEDRIQLEAAVAALTDTQREVFILRAVHGCSYDEIAQLVGVSKLACRSRYCRAMARMVEVCR
jgi:RNA polymerase sigma-70 factor (ECF subfamily)